MAKCCICGRNTNILKGDHPLSEHYKDLQLCNTCITNRSKIKYLDNKKNIQSYYESKKYFQKYLENPKMDRTVRELLTELIEECDLNSAELRGEQANDTSSEGELMSGIKFKAGQEKYQHNTYYEYNVAVVPNTGSGTVDRAKLQGVIEKHASNGWRLHTIYSNQIGKNALVGLNATICEDILIFERCIKSENL